MEKREPIRLDSALKKRLHQACRAHESSSFDTRNDTGSDALGEPEGPLGRSTLGTSLKRRLQNA